MRGRTGWVSRGASSKVRKSGTFCLRRWHSVHEMTIRFLLRGAFKGLIGLGFGSAGASMIFRPAFAPATMGVFFLQPTRSSSMYLA